MASLIPPIGTRGRYSLIAPFVANGGVMYTCSAIRNFVDLDNLGVDIFNMYYFPNGLEQTICDRDRKNNEAIITLTSDTEAPIYVPSSYIASFPDLNVRNYQHVVLSASLGPLPDYIDLTFAKAAMASALSDILGVDPTVNVSVAASTGVVSPEDHEALEAARAAAINNRKTPYARVLEQDTEIQQLGQRLAILEQICKDHGLIPA